MISNYTEKYAWFLLPFAGLYVYYGADHLRSDQPLTGALAGAIALMLLFLAARSLPATQTKWQKVTSIL